MGTGSVSGTVVTVMLISVGGNGVGEFLCSAIRSVAVGRGAVAVGRTVGMAVGNAVQADTHMTIAGMSPLKRMRRGYTLA